MKNKKILIKKIKNRNCIRQKRVPPPRRAAESVRPWGSGARELARPWLGGASREGSTAARTEGRGEERRRVGGKRERVSQRTPGARGEKDDERVGGREGGVGGIRHRG